MNRVLPTIYRQFPINKYFIQAIMKIVPDANFHCASIYKKKIV
ncbi:MAG: hypothetical protein UZ08_BCD001002071 [Candidatus Parvibacillus calidus]|nr:MAG: hypothetical protein UZ08_BCD001002071 [Candidatus Parvibacillus calidus]